jgi:hypothetical protein
MDIFIAVGFLLLVLVTALGAVDTRDGRDWQVRSHWPARREGD